MLVSAAAGAGKSATLIERVISLVREGVSPSRILTLTFNRDAADSFTTKLKIRMAEEGFAARGYMPVTNTFHAFAYGCVREALVGDAEWVKMSLARTGAEFKLAQVALKKAGLKAADVKPYLTASSLLRESLVPLADERAAIKMASNLEPFRRDPEVVKAAVRFSIAYQEVKAADNKFDFGDMLLLFGHFVDGDQQFAEWVGTMYAHVQVDEAQDLSPARWKVAKAAARDARSRVVVGDLRQAINSFSGSDLNIIRRLYREEDYRLLLLPVNRRSTRSIVDFGNRICQGRDWHLGGDVRPLDDVEEGPDVAIWGTASPEDEADRIASEVAAMYGYENAPVRDRPTVFVLSRTNAALADCEAALRAMGVPLRVRGVTGGLWASNVGKTILAYLGAADNMVGDDTMLAANKPVRYVRREDLQAALAKMGYVQSFPEALREVGTPGCRAFATDIESLAGQPFAKRAAWVASWLKADIAARAKEDMDNVSEDDDKGQLVDRLCTEASKQADFESLLRASKVTRAGEGKPYVELSSIHKVKGDEADVVYVIGVREKHLPFIKAQSPEAIDEERRIFYVAVTRAKSLLTISTGGAPSMFLRDLGVAPEVRGLKKPVEDREESTSSRSGNPPGVRIRKGKSKEALEDEAEEVAEARRAAAVSDCPICEGEGEVRGRECRACGGTGEARKRRAR